MLLAINNDQRWSVIVIVDGRDCFIHSEDVGIVKGHHMPVPSDYVHRLLERKCRMSISCAGFLSNHYAFLVVKNHFGKFFNFSILVELPFFLISNLVDSMTQALWQWGEWSLIFFLRTSTHFRQQFFLSIQKISIFLFLDHTVLRLMVMASIGA